MLDTQTPGPNQGPGDGPPITPDEFRRRASVIQDATPNAFDSLRAAAESTGGVSSTPRTTVTPKPLRVKDALGRGAVRGVNEASSAVVGLGGWLTKNIVRPVVSHIPVTPTATVGDTKAFQTWNQEFLDWYDSGHSTQINPLQVPEQFIGKLFGAPQEGLGGFIEGVGQVGVGLIATGGLSVEAQVGSKAAAIGVEALTKGALIDGAFFDPYQKRIANMIEDAKLPFVSDLASFMAAHPNDNEATARFKGVLEGAAAGQVVGQTLHALNALRIRTFAKAGQFFGGSKDAAEKEIQRQLTLAAEAQPNPTDPVQVIEHQDGTATVVASTPPAGTLAPAPANIPDLPGITKNADGSVSISGFRGVAQGADPLAPGHKGVTFISPSEEVANGYATQGGRAKGDVSQLSLDMKSPLVVGGMHTDPIWKTHDLNDLIDKARTEGHDGIIIESGHGGHPEFVALDQKGIVVTPKAIENGMHFDNVGDAQNFAASVIDAHKNDLLPRGEVTPEVLKAVRSRADEILNAGSLDEVNAKFQQWGADFNFARSSSPIEAKAQIEAVSKELPDITTLARSLGQQPHELTIQLAQQMYAGRDVGEALTMAKRAFGDTKDLPQRLLGARAWLYAKAADVSRLSRLADANPENAAAMGELSKALDHLWEFHANVSGSASNVARTLEAQKINPEPLVPAVAGAAAKTEGEQVAQAATDALDVRTPEQQVEASARQAKQAAGAADAGTPKKAPAPKAASPAELATRQVKNDGLQEPHKVSLKDPKVTDIGIEKTPQVDLPTVKQDVLPPQDGATAPVGIQRAGDTALPDPLAKQAGIKGVQIGSQQYKSPGTGIKGVQIGSQQYKSPGTGITSGLTKRELRGLARQIRLGEGDPQKILDAMFAVRAEKVAKADPTLMQKVIGFRMNAMLSGPKTLAVNAVSNAAAALQQPVEMYWAGIRSENPALRQMGWDMMTGLRSEFMDSFTAAWKSFVVGENLLDRSRATFEDKTAEMAAQGGKTWLQTLVNVPSRILMSTDEFFKQLNYRTHVRAQALRDARDLGLTELPDASRRVAEHVDDTMNGAFSMNGSGAGTNPFALQYSRVGTFTNDLGEGTIGKWIQNGAIEHPFVRLVMPFVRTPVNLFRWTWERTPGLSRFSDGFQREIAAGGERAAIAQSKVELGTALYGGAAMLALTGQVTGAGPSNPELRRQWMQAGNQPYSLKIPGTDKWVSYRRADPLLAPVGLTAAAMENLAETGRKLASTTRIRNLQRDRSSGHPVAEYLGVVADFVHSSGEMVQQDGTRIATALIASAAANVSSKTFLQGAVEFMDGAASGDPNKVQNLLVNTIGSFVPNIMRQTAPDNTIRETRGLLDELQARTPWSGGLEPQRNLFGEPVLRAPGYLNRAFNPFTITDKSTDPTVADELVSLGRAMAMPAEKRLGGAVDLTDRSKWYDQKTSDKARQNQSPYDRMLDIMAAPGNGKPSLKDALARLIHSDAWTQISDGTAAQPGGEKYRLASQLIGTYQDMAYARVKGEYPTLARALATEDAQNAAAALQGEEGVAAVQKLFQSQR